MFMYKLNKRVLMLLLVLSLYFVIQVRAWDEGVACNNNFDSNFWSETQVFANIIDSYPGWNKYFLTHDPYPYMWKEESSGGSDNNYADYTELSLIVGHSANLSGGLIGIGFGTRGYARPNEVRLGYKSPDNYGYAIWTFVIQCSVLADSSYPSWLYSLTGLHMFLGFKTQATITPSDLRELAYRLTGTGGYSKEKVQYAFFHTFVDRDGIHNNNVARILAENSNVADGDYIDIFDTQTPVDNVKLVITYPP